MHFYEIQVYAVTLYIQNVWILGNSLMSNSFSDVRKEEIYFTFRKYGLMDKIFYSYHMSKSLNVLLIQMKLTHVI